MNSDSHGNKMESMIDIVPHNTSQSGGCPKDVNFGHWSYPLDDTLRTSPQPKRRSFFRKGM